MPTGTRSIEAGRELALQMAYRIKSAQRTAEKSNPSTGSLLFWAGFMSALSGHMCRSIGSDSAVAILQQIQPILIAIEAKENKKTH